MTLKIAILETEGILPNSFHEANITLRIKTRQMYYKKSKLQTNLSHEHWYKILNKMSANQINL